MIGIPALLIVLVVWFLLWYFGTKHEMEDLERLAKMNKENRDRNK